MTKRWRAIQAGTGPRGELWIEALQKNPNVEGVAFVDTDAKTLAKVGKKFGISEKCLFTNLEEAIRVSEADFLIDVTPPQFHGRVSGLALASDLHVLSEKPIADDFGVAKQLVQSARAAGKTYMISQNYRFHPFPQALKSYIQEGMIGKIEAAVISFYAGMNFGADNFRSQMNHPLINDMSIHHFDLMRCCFGQDARAVYAHSYNPSWSWYQGDAAAMLLIDFDEMIVNYHSSWCNVGRGENEWRVDGEKGSIVSDGAGLKLVQGRIWTDGQGTTPGQVQDLALPTMPLQDHEYALAEFLSALLEERQPECSGEDNLKSLAMVFAAIKSAQRGEKVYLEEIMEQSSISPG